MAQEGDAICQEVFSMARATDLIMLLPWCVANALLFCYMSEVMAMAIKQDEDIPATTSVSEPEGSTALGCSSSPAHPTGTPPLVPLLPDIPFVGTTLLWCLFPEFTAGPTQTKWDHSSSGSLDSHQKRGPMSASKKFRLKVSTTLSRMMNTHLNWHQRQDLALLNNGGRSLLAPF